MSFDAIVVTIPHDRQRYATVGDWLGDAEDCLHIRVSDLGDWKAEACVAIHEFVEALLCRAHGITQQQVDDFDFACEKAEPGDQPEAPYHEEHLSATTFERMLATMLNIDWEEYCRKLASM